MHPNILKIIPGSRTNLYPITKIANLVEPQYAQQVQDALIIWYNSDIVIDKFGDGMQNHQARREWKKELRQKDDQETLRLLRHNRLSSKVAQNAVMILLILPQLLKSKVKINNYDPIQAQAQDLAQQISDQWQDATQEQKIELIDKIDQFLAHAIDHISKNSAMLEHFQFSNF